MGKGFGRVFKKSNKKYPYPFTNSAFVVPTCQLFTSQHDNTNDYGVTVIDHNQPAPVSNLTITTQVDTDSNNDDDTHSVETHRKHNNSTHEITETTTTRTLVQATVNYRLCQMISSTPTASLKLSPSGKQYICFQSYGKYSHATRCSKLRALTKFIDLILDIESFE